MNKPTKYASLSSEWVVLYTRYKEKTSTKEMMRIYQGSANTIKKHISREIQDMCNTREFGMVIQGLDEFKRTAKLDDFKNAYLPTATKYLPGAIKKCMENNIIYISDLEKDETIDILRSMQKNHVKALYERFWFINNHSFIRFLYGFDDINGWGMRK